MESFSGDEETLLPILGAAQSLQSSPSHDWADTSAKVNTIMQPVPVTSAPSPPGVLMPGKPSGSASTVPEAPIHGKRWATTPLSGDLARFVDLNTDFNVQWEQLFFHP